jgi:hypothetical protein
MNDDWIADLVRSVNETAPRETLEKFDIGKIERTDDPSTILQDEAPNKRGRSNTLAAAVSEASEKWRAGDRIEPEDRFIAREVAAFWELRDKRDTAKYRHTKGSERKRDIYTATQGERDEQRLSRPIIAIDSEGQDYDGDDIMYGDVLYKSHGTFSHSSLNKLPDTRGALRPKTELSRFMFLPIPNRAA